MLKLSIIVPAWGPQQHLDDTLVSVLENRPEHVEVLVPHAADYHDPYDLSGEVRFVPAAESSLVGLLNAGVRASSTPLVHWLCPGMLATQGWTEGPVDRIGHERNARRAVVAVAPSVQSVRDGADEDRCDVLARGADHATYGGLRWTLAGRVVREVGCPTERETPLHGPSLYAGFCQRDVLLACGLWCETLPVRVSDADLAAKMSRGGHRCIALASSHVMQAHDLLPACKPWRVAWHEEQLFFQHLSLAGALGRVPFHLLRVWVDMLGPGRPAGMRARVVRPVACVVGLTRFAARGCRPIPIVGASWDVGPQAGPVDDYLLSMPSAERPNVRSDRHAA